MKALIRSKVGNHELKTSAGGVIVRFVWDTSNNFEVALPIEWTVQLKNGNEIVRSKNYAQEILNSYPNDFEFVRYIDEPKIVVPLIKQAAVVITLPPVPTSEVEKEIQYEAV